MKEAIDEVDKMIINKEKGYVVAINVDVVMKTEEDLLLREISDKAYLTVVDGKPLIWISKLQKKPIVEKISGSDLVPNLCELANDKGYSFSRNR